MKSCQFLIILSFPPPAGQASRHTALVKQHIGLRRDDVARLHLVRGAVIEHVPLTRVKVLAVRRIMASAEPPAVVRHGKQVVNWRHTRLRLLHNARQVETINGVVYILYKKTNQHEGH